MGEWVSDQDRQAHETEMLLFGHAACRTLPDGRLEHIPRHEWDFQHASDTKQ
jgi:hypothetical protein